ncbi:MAG: multidrug ABC transporter ATP-binding protein [Candidatus Neomarinimicrobiota bacterium]|jgi:ABC-2 type transport system ATP-binding protein|nr:MAG: multidrug ABC transporter ATP-binding protein [Candidatus Neomarinimicrobiota bacterium]|tara:strand:+ start:1542 stop:2468 length:927 start_codon:yes stop_codon:yes gene_type:complete
METPAIDIKGLTKSYGELKALNGVNISIKKGEFFGLLGPNGAGKTTTINILTGLVFKESGSAKVFGKDTIKDFRYTRSKIGIAAQEFSVDWFFPIEKLLFFQAGYYGIKPKDAKPLVDSLLNRLGLSSKRNSRLRQLSGGMKRRFQIAKALVHDPEILILDEPTAGVDVELRRDLWKYLQDLHSRGKTILLTTHYIEEAELLCENVAIIDNGKILKMGAPKELTRELGEAGITVVLENLNGLNKKDLENYKYTSDKNRLHFSVKDPDEELPKIIRVLSNAGLHIQKIESNKSSLEDVFLNLTGKGINE